MNIIIIIIYLVFYSTFVHSSDVEVIELHDSKTLDQIVLDKIDDDISENENEVETINENESESTDTLASEVNQIVVEEDMFLQNYSLEEISNFLNNSKNIKSNILQKELSNFLQNLNLDFNEIKDREIFFYIVNYFYDVGNISQAYNLVKSRDLQDDKNLDYYFTIEINYLLATFQLENVCNLKNDYNFNIKIQNFLLEKVDIFCSVLEGNLSEADLLNSIMIESEINVDQTFQELYYIISGKNDTLSQNNSIFKNLLNNNLIFLYSAMARIAEIPLTETFLLVDPKNLAIPIILNQSTPIELRIRAANESYIGKAISVDSLAALYQSVDFNTEQFNNSDKTLNELSYSKEISMAYYFQLINVQIFPSERLSVLIDFWNYSKEKNLENIAYALSYKILQSIQLSSENIEFGSEIANAYIYNQDYAKALEWIEFFENSMEKNDQSSYARVLLNLYSVDDISSLIDIINENFDKFFDTKSKNNEELIFILLSILQKQSEKTLEVDFENIFEKRLYPSFSLTENIKDSIEDQDYNKFLLYSIVSVNDTYWSNIHPDHLKLLLLGYLNYDDGNLIKKIIIEIFEDYKIL